MARSTHANRGTDSSVLLGQHQQVVLQLVAQSLALHNRAPQLLHDLFEDRRRRADFDVVCHFKGAVLPAEAVSNQWAGTFHRSANARAVA